MFFFSFVLVPFSTELREINGIIDFNPSLPDTPSTSPSHSGDDIDESLHFSQQVILNIKQEADQSYEYEEPTIKPRPRIVNDVPIVILDDDDEPDENQLVWSQKLVGDQDKKLIERIEENSKLAKRKSAQQIDPIPQIVQKRRRSTITKESTSKSSSKSSRRSEGNVASRSRSKSTDRGASSSHHRKERPSTESNSSSKSARRTEGAVTPHSTSKSTDRSASSSRHREDRLSTESGSSSKSTHRYENSAAEKVDSHARRKSTDRRKSPSRSRTDLLSNDSLSPRNNHSSVESNHEAKKRRLAELAPRIEVPSTSKPDTHKSSRPVVKNSKSRGEFLTEPLPAKGPLPTRRQSIDSRKALDMSNNKKPVETVEPYETILRPKNVPIKRISRVPSTTNPAQAPEPTPSTSKMPETVPPVKSEFKLK